MISKKYKKQREDDIFNNLPADNNDNQRNTMLTHGVFYRVPTEMFEFVR